MSDAGYPRPAPSLWRALGLLLLVLLGLCVGAVAGLFLASWAGWLPDSFVC